MFTAVIALGLLGSAPQAAPVELVRTFQKGKTYSYEVKSHLLTEAREPTLTTFIPSEIDINYDFNYLVKELRPGGFGYLVYKRPFIYQIEGETAESAPKTEKIKVDYNMGLDVSPINAVTNIKDLNPPKPPTKGGGLKRLEAVLTSRGVSRETQLDIFGFVISIYQLALGIGSLDSALDFNPKLPVDEVKVGDTWKKTVSYQPQELKGSKGQQAVQRLDMTFKYEGLVTVGNATYQRITATVSLNSDAALFVNQLMGTKPEESGLRKMPLQFTTNLSFDLDPKTLDTVRGSTSTKGAWSLEVSGSNEPVMEEKLQGKASIKLVSIK